MKCTVHIEMNADKSDIIQITIREILNYTESYEHTFMYPKTNKIKIGNVA